MAQVIIRNLEDRVVQRLKAQAAAEKTSLEQKLRQVVTEAAGRDDERFRQITQRIGEKLKGLGWDTTELIRRDRER